MRTAILIDGNNIGMSVNQMMEDMSCMADFDKLIGHFAPVCRVVYFREGNNISPKFMRRLSDRWGAIFRPCGKSVDVSMAIAAIHIAPSVDRIVLFSGDKDFVPAINIVKSQFVRVEVIATEAAMSNDIAMAADQIHFIKPEDTFKL